MWAARLGVPIESLDIIVEADYDSRGELGVAGEVPPSYLQVRYERYWREQLAPAQKQLIRLAAPMGERILDVACGTGLVTLLDRSVGAEEPVTTFPVNSSWRAAVRPVEPPEIPVTPPAGSQTSTTSILSSRPLRRSSRRRARR